MELEGLRARLEAQKLSDKSVVPDLTLNGIEEFLGRDKIPQWMRESSAVLKQFLTANQAPTRPPDVGGEVQAKPPPGNALAYRIWATMLRSQGAYQQRYHSQGMSAKARETLDKLPWEEALPKGGATFVDPGVQFLTEEGILRWAAANGNHIPVNAAPSGDCRKCTSLRVEEGKRRHWHFQCLHWSWLFEFDRGAPAGVPAPRCEDEQASSGGSPDTPGTRVRGLQATSLRQARQMWDEAANGNGEGGVRARALQVWRPSTRQRYRSAIGQGGC